MIKVRQMVFIFSFGAAWGLIEAFVGGALHIIRVPYTGIIMASIGFSILYIALSSGMKPSKLFAVSLVAASLKLTSAAIFSVPLLSRGVVNPALSIAMQGLAFSLVAHFGLFSAARRAASALLSGKAAG